jgi:threonine dehydratase
MHELSLQLVRDASARIAGVARRTPLERSIALSAVAGCDIYLKLECWQRTRSFKMRGAYNAIASLSRQELGQGLVTASAGNHGQAVALAAREVGARATIFVPETGSAMKRARIRAFGAELRPVPGIYDDAQAAAHDYAERTGALYVHAFTDARVVAGQGTVGLEILEELPNVREVVVPVGGGGLIAGIGTALKHERPGTKIIGVQSDRTPAMHAAFVAGQVVDVPIGETIADGLAGCTAEITYDWARAVVDDMLLVEEARLPAAIRTLYARDGLVAEGSAAVPVAALEAGLLELRGPAVLIISGGNIDAGLLAGILTGD